MNSRKNPTSKSCKVRIGLTIGDPSGIGPSITVQALRRLEKAFEFVVIGDRRVLERVTGYSKIASVIRIEDIANIAPKSFRFGQVSPVYGRASIGYLDRAFALWQEEQIDCLVTCPISKESLHKAGYSFTGHTEYFAAKTGVSNPVMMLLNEDLKFGLVTRHIPLKEVSKKLTRAVVEKTAVAAHQALRGMFLVPEPKIVVCGFNPHASDNGVIGKEEHLIIKPAVLQLKRKGISVSGPLPADVAIAKMKEGLFDCAIALYHDQALIPLKFSSKDSGVNLTLGLPFVRTSPLHGTAFDIASTNSPANPNSLIRAIEVAAQCTLNLKNG